MIQILILKKERVNKMLDLCKLLGVAEGEEFKLVSDNSESKYIIVDNILNLVIGNRPYVSELTINDINAYKLKIIKLPKKKQFTDDELCILRNIESEINTLGRNINGTIYVTSDYGKSYLKLFNNLFQSLDIGEEIIIDDYVER